LLLLSARQIGADAGSSHSGDTLRSQRYALQPD